MPHGRTNRSSRPDEGGFHFGGLMSVFTTEDRALHAAAVRAGLRTAAQSARGAGAALVASIGVSLLGVDWAVVAATAGASVITVAWAGVDAYLGMISSGVPKEYQDVAFGDTK